jgi:hypothetical protein
MKFGFSQSEIITTAKNLGLPTDGFIQRRIARAFDLVNTNKVSKIDDGIFKVRSQYEADKYYVVNLNHGEPSCDCPDGERTINCKHRIASLLFSQKQAQAIVARNEAIIKTTDGDDGDYWRRCWLIKQGNSRPMVYEERDRRLFCNCGAHYEDCEHKQLVVKTVKRIINECGSNEAKALQDKLNGQVVIYGEKPSVIDSQKNNGNGAHAPSHQQLDLRDPFQEAEQNDIEQIEGRRNGEVTWKLRNGEVVISYKGIMELANKHQITFDEAVHSDTYTVIAKGHCGTSERVSGKPINGNANTAIELAKRNAARQLLPYAELKAVEKKAQLEAEFDWQKAKAKCVELVGEANVGIIIHDLTQAGKLRQDNPSHYDRTEWLMIYDACQKDAQVERDPKSVNRWSYNSVVFLEQCKEAIEKVRTEKQVEANEQPLENSNGKPKLQMDKKLRTWLVESDGTKKEISCREICEQFESKQNPSIVTRLRAGIDSGADISTVELDN